MRYYVPKIKLEKKINNNINHYLICECGEYYIDHFVDSCYCNKFSPIHFKQTHSQDFYDFLENKKCYSSMDNIFGYGYIEDIDIRPELCKILSPDFYPDMFDDEDLENNITIKDLKEFVRTLVIKNEEDKSCKYRRQIMKSRKEEN